MNGPDVSAWDWIPSPHYSPGRAGHSVEGVVNHFTAGGSGRAMAKWLASPNAGVSAHILTCRDGGIIQQVRFSDTAWHAGTRKGRGDFWLGEEDPDTNVNLVTIGIENSNHGWLLEEGGRFFIPRRLKNGTYVTGRPYKGPAPVQAVGHDGKERWWEPYTDELVSAHIEVMQAIVDRYPAVTRETYVAHSDVSPSRKQDPGPLWPWEAVRTAVWGTTFAAVHPATVSDTGETEAEEDHDDDIAARRHYDYDEEMCLVDPEA